MNFNRQSSDDGRSHGMHVVEGGEEPDNSGFIFDDADNPKRAAEVAELVALQIRNEARADALTVISRARVRGRELAADRRGGGLQCGR